LITKLNFRKCVCVCVCVCVFYEILAPQTNQTFRLRLGEDIDEMGTLKPGSIRGLTGRHWSSLATSATSNSFCLSDSSSEKVLLYRIKNKVTCLCYCYLHLSTTGDLRWPLTSDPNHYKLYDNDAILKIQCPYDGQKLCTCSAAIAISITSRWRWNKSRPTQRLNTLIPVN